MEMGAKCVWYRVAYPHAGGMRRFARHLRAIAWALCLLPLVASLSVWLVHRIDPASRQLIFTSAGCLWWLCSDRRGVAVWVVSDWPAAERTRWLYGATNEVPTVTY